MTTTGSNQTLCAGVSIVQNGLISNASLNLNCGISVSLHAYNLLFTLDYKCF